VEALAPALTRIKEALESECRVGLFAKHKLLLAAIPDVLDETPIVRLVVRGPGTPIDESPLPRFIGGAPTVVVLGLPPEDCTELPQSPASGAPHLAGPPLHAPGNLYPKDKSFPGTFGAFAHRNGDSEIVGVTAAHVLMTKEEHAQFKNGSLSETYDEDEVYHRQPVVGGHFVGRREINIAALRKGVDVALVKDLSLEWQPVPGETHVIPGFVFDGLSRGTTGVPETLCPFRYGYSSGGFEEGDWCGSGLSFTGLYEPKHELAKVGKVGMKTHLTFGSMCSSACIANNQMPLRVVMDQIVVKPLEVGTSFCDFGDSGSVIWTADGADHRIVGILSKKFAIDGGTWGIVCPALKIQEMYDIQFCVGAGGTDVRVMAKNPDRS